MSSPWANLALVPAVIALALAILGTIRVLSAAINGQAFLDVLLKLCAAGNLDRLVKLCHAAGENIPCALGAKALALGASGPLPEEARGYRDASQEPLRQRLIARYQEATALPLQRLSWAVILWAAALVSVLGAVLLFPPSKPHPLVGYWFQVALLGTFAVALFGVSSLRKIHHDTALVLDGLLDPLLKYWISQGALDAPPAAVPSPVPHVPAPSAGAGNTLRFGVRLPGGEETIVELPRQEILKIGSHDRSHLRLDHPSVARMHAVMEYNPSKREWVVIDLGSHDGTWVNGEKASKGAVRPGDLLLLGEVTVRFLSG
jgi:hypothetical protein